MTLRTGTSQNGVIHRYYTCSTCARKGKSVCKGRSIRMDKLDRLVTDHLVEQLFHPERLAGILGSLSARRAEKAESVNRRVMTLQREVTDAEDKLKRLYRLVEDGITDLDDVLKDRLNNLKAERDRAMAALEAAKYRLLLEFALILRSLSDSGVACARSSLLDRCPSEKPTCNHLLTPSRSMTTTFALEAAGRCWNAPSLPDRSPVNLVRR
jgi:hypothetical protein